MIVGFGTNNGLVGRIKRFILQDRATHTWLEYRSPIFGQPLMIHATLGGVKVQLLSEYVKKNKVLARYESTVNIPDAYATAVAHLDEKYDYPGLFFAIVILWAWRWFRIKMKNVLASPTAMICSELVVGCDPTGVIPEWRDIDPERVSPQMILDICEKSQFFEEMA